MKRFLLFSIMLCILATACCGFSSFDAAVTMADGVDLTSKSSCLVDFSSGKVLYENNSSEHLPVASMVKMMTILLTLEQIDSGNLSLDTMITTSENASSMGGSQVFIDPYVQYSAEDMLRCVVMASANDASVAIAEHISGSEKVFVAKMNERAKELGMNDTNYSNCTGLPAPEQYSSAKDSAILLKQVVGHEVYHKYSTIWMDKLVHPSGRETELVNTNRLVRYYEGCDGGKTGSTNEAGCCLCASAKRGNMRLISVVIGAKNSQTRFNECSSLFNYGFANFENKNLLSLDKSVSILPVDKGKVSEVEIFAKENFSVISQKSEKNSYEVNYELPSAVKAPTKAGNVVGKAIITENGEIIKEVDLTVNVSLENLSVKDCFDKIVHAW